MVINSVNITWQIYSLLCKVHDFKRKPFHSDYRNAYRKFQRFRTWLDFQSIWWFHFGWTNFFRQFFSAYTFILHGSNRWFDLNLFFCEDFFGMAFGIEYCSRSCSNHLWNYTESDGFVKIYYTKTFFLYFCFVYQYLFKTHLRIVLQSMSPDLRHCCDSQTCFLLNISNWTP